MKLTAIILIFIILTSSGAFAMTFKEGIKVNGGGSLSSSTYTGDSSDAVNGHGEQSYSRDVDIQSDSSNLKSKYIYLKKASLKTGVLNHYKVSATSPIGSQHDISIDSNASINSSAEIQRQGNSITTNYEMMSPNGILSEHLTSGEPLDTVSLKHLRNVAETDINGNFTLKSAWNENVAISRGFDAADLLSRLQLVDMAGENSVLEGDTMGAPKILIGGSEPDPKEEATLLNDKGLAMFQDRSYSKALQFYDSALNIDPENPTVLYNRGLVRQKMGDYDKALNDFNSAIGANPDDANVWFSKANTLVFLNRTVESIAAYDKALTMDSQNIKILQNKGAALRKLGRYDEALKSIDEAIQIDPQFLPAYETKALIYKAMGNLSAFNDTSAIVDKLMKEQNGQNQIQTVIELGG